MENLLFCLGALVFFTIGFRLVKRGNPYLRGGGDSYTKRRTYRMLGWMMWTTAAVLVLLSLINQLLTDQLTGAVVAQSGTAPAGPPIHTVTSTAGFVPNLLHAPSLQADAGTGGSSAANPSTVASGSLSLTSIESHTASAMVPSLVKPLHDEAPTAAKPLDSGWDTSADAYVDKSPVAQTAPVAPSPVTPASFPAQDSVASTPIQAPAAPAAVPDPAKMKQLDAEVAAADAIVQKNPMSVVGFLQRGNAYGNEGKWDLAKRDYQHALQIDSHCVTALFNIAELDFMQGHYDTARPGFLALIKDAEVGDLAKYNVFLCDMFGGHEQTAAKELAVFNEVGSDASYYFANVAWSLYHKKNDDAQNWWQSASGIFAPDKVNLYAKPLIDLGYIKVAS